MSTGSSSVENKLLTISYFEPIYFFLLKADSYCIICHGVKISSSSLIRSWFSNWIDHLFSRISFLCFSISFKASFWLSHQVLKTLVGTIGYFGRFQTWFTLGHSLVTSPVRVKGSSYVGPLYFENHPVIKLSIFSLNSKLAFGIFFISIIDLLQTVLT